MGWLDWTIDDPAPDGLGGYSALNVPPEVAPELRYGMLWHSAEGEFWGPPSELMRARGLSWDVTVGRSDVFRHRPRPTFVSWHGGGPAQNIGLVGVEVAGARGEPWTETQRGLILRVALDTWRYFGWQPIVLGFQTDRTQEAVRAAILGRGRGSLWEHTWVSATNCPSGRDDYAWLMAALAEALIEEGDMTPKELEEALRPLRDEIAAARDEIAVVKGKVETTFNQVNDKAGAVLNGVLAAISDLPAGAGLSDEDVQRIAAAVASLIAERMRS